MSADPTSGEPAGIRRVARLHDRHAEAVRAGARHVVTATETASTGWTGRAQERFLAVGATIPARAQRVAARLEVVATALHDYAQEVEQIQDEAQRVQRAQQTTADDAAANARAIRDAAQTASSADAVEADMVQLHRLQDGAAGIAGLQARLDVQWEELVARRAAADRRAVSALQEPEVLGRILSARAITAMGDEQFLAWVGSLDHEAIAAAADDPNLGIRLGGTDAEGVAAWWEGLSAETKDALIAALPTVIGNLDGVPYADRGEANCCAVARECRAIERRIGKLIGIIHRGAPLTAAQRAELATLHDRKRAVEAIRATMRDSTAERPYTIVSLTLGRPPLAAIGVGDMDTATRVTTAVPGMGTTVEGGLRSWAGGAANLREAQITAATTLGVDQNVATVAWVGYDTPKLPPALEVMSSAKAKAGAVRLETFLAGVSATRGWAPGDHLSLVGHSYGTTTATLAAARTPVDDLTLLASAGVDRSVPDVAAVQVPTGHTWASQANDDLVANIGRGMVEGIGPSHRQTQPGILEGNRSWAIAMPSEHPTDPGGAGWGARTFSSDDQTVDGRHYEGSDGHGATPATEALENGTAIEQHGYLDRGTSSLRNTAYTSLGYTPDGRLIP